MNGFLAVFRKELRTYFVSPIAYIFVAGFLMLSGWFFDGNLSYYIREYLFAQQGAYGPGGGGPDINTFLRDGVIQLSLTFFLFLSPILTMRLLAAEKKAHTDELLFTSPVSIESVVLGKFAGAMAVVALAIGLTLYIPWCMGQVGDVDWGPVITGYLGLVGIAGLFVAMGVFASALTEDQIIAAVLSFVGLLGLLILPVVGEGFDNGTLKAVFEYMAFQPHFERLTKGLLESRDIVYVVTSIGLFLYLAIRYIGAGQWRTQSARKTSGRRWILFIAGVGLVFVYFGIALILPASPVESQVWRDSIWVLGLLLIAGYAAWDWENLMERLRTRSFVFSSLLSAEVLAIALVVGGANWLADRRNIKWDITDVGLYTLAPQSLKVAAELPGEVEIAAFMRETEPTRDKAKELLGLYEEASDKIRVRFIDPDKNPEETRKYKVDLYNTLVFTYGEGENKQTTRTNNITEQEITGSLIKMSREGNRSICFVTGHGEKTLSDTSPKGFDSASKAIEGQGYDLKDINLVAENPLDGCTVVIVAGPERNPTEGEFRKLDAYLDGGGRLLVMVDPQPSMGMEGWLKKYGVVVHDDIVVDVAGVVIGDNYLSTVVTPPHPVHEITKDIPGQIIFPGVRTLDSGVNLAPGLLVGSLIQTREDVWGETNIEKEDPPKFNEKADRAGPLTVALWMTRGGQDANPMDQGDPMEARDTSAKMVVVGDSDFANNRYIYLAGYNSDFLLNAISWLADESNLVSIRPRERDTQNVNIPSETFRRAAFLIPSGLVPAFIVTAGIILWMRRRRS